jgi:CRISPR-associated endonuclease/helicase Cas3
MTLLVDVSAGGYDPVRGFVGAAGRAPVEAIRLPSGATATMQPDESDADRVDGDARSSDYPRAVTLADHAEHVVAEARELCAALGIDAVETDAIVRAARWHDLGKAHAVFQDTMRRGLRDMAPCNDVLLAKTENTHLRHTRPYFRHELASALAFLSHANWAREADLVAYLVAAHHGKVRMSLRALPAERAPDGEQANGRFARGIWERDMLPEVELGGGESFAGGPLTLSIMDLGEDDVTGASWTKRTRELLNRFGPFKLAWFEALLTTADWRASARERRPPDAASTPAELRPAPATADAGRQPSEASGDD